MGILNSIRNASFSKFSESFSQSSMGREVFQDWYAVTEGLNGTYTAVTIAHNLRGGALVYRCRKNSVHNRFAISIPGNSQKPAFQEDFLYKVRLKFSNSVVLYGKMHAYKVKHAAILDITDLILENISDSHKLEIEFVGDLKKKYVIKFSLKGANQAIQSVKDCAVNNAD